MKGSKTFSMGGVEPLPGKSGMPSMETRNAILPSVAVVPFLQHAGAEAECLVSEGELVREGQIIGRAKEYLSANVHSPIPGTVVGIRSINLPEGGRSKAAVIQLGGAFDRLGRRPERYLWQSLSATDLIRTIADKGVVGMSGDGVPTQARFALDRKNKVKTLIVNAAESEPYLTGDHRLAAQKAAEIVEGIRIACKILLPDRVFVGIGEGQQDSIAALSAAVAALADQKPAIEIVPLEDRYPQGDEILMIDALTGTVVPTSSDPAEAGFAVFNVATLYAVWEAIVLNKPLLERYVTISGDAVKFPATLKVRIGTPIGDLIEECGGFIGVPRKVIVNGPFKGTCVFNLDIPVTKRTSAVLALTDGTVHAARETPCINCGRCIRSCPVGLNPARLRRLLVHRLFNDALSEGLAECRECGACAFICPARLPLVQVLQEGKNSARKGA
jgi:Na+-translocating ferredoxin:NAD+ oxidoreductase subunit C